MPFLSEANITEIDAAGRHILKKVGIKILDAGMRKRLKADGAAVDEASQKVRVGSQWLDHYLGRAPSRFTLYARDARYDLDLGSGKVHFGGGGRVFQILDMSTGGFRPTLLRDVAHTAALTDALEHIRFYIIACQAADLPSDHYHLNDFYQAFLHTAKHVMGGVDNLAGAQQMFDLACCIAGDAQRLRQKPFVSVMTNPISPLTVDAETLKILEFCVLRGIPVTCAPAPISGATAPASLAGALAQLHAEALFGVALIQFLSPGAPAMYGAVASSMDLRTMDLAMGSVEAAMINSGAVALAHRYRLPIYATAGLTDAKLPDIQSGFEKGVSYLLLGMAGADFIHLAAGMLDSGNSIAYEQYVIDNEILGMVERILRGIRVDKETLGLDCIEKVGPGGTYVLEDHTVDHMFSEFFFPQLAVREQYDKWTAIGEPTPNTKAQVLIKEYLDAPEVRLDRETEDRVRRRFPEIVDLEPNNSPEGHPGKTTGSGN
jgi:trimethylamine--corrinoid protein Co-methyltransferase